MKNLGFTIGLATGFLLFTKEGKEISKKFVNSVNQATEEITNLGKDLIKETMPETSKAMEKGDEDNGKA